MKIMYLTIRPTILIYPDNFFDRVRLFLTWLVSPMKWHIDGMGNRCLVLTEKENKVSKYLTNKEFGELFQLLELEALLEKRQSILDLDLENRLGLLGEVKERIANIKSKEAQRRK